MREGGRGGRGDEGRGGEGRGGEGRGGRREKEQGDMKGRREYVRERARRRQRRKTISDLWQIFLLLLCVAVPNDLVDTQVGMVTIVKSNGSTDT